MCDVVSEVIVITGVEQRIWRMTSESVQHLRPFSSSPSLADSSTNETSETAPQANYTAGDCSSLATLLDCIRGK